LISFVRKRILRFDVLVLFILQKTNQSYQVCLDEFLTGLSKIPTKGSLSTARSQLCYKVFKRLNLLINNIFYTKSSYHKWKGMRILAVDGSTLKLPNHNSLNNKFSKHYFGAKANVGHWMSRISYLYDVLNGTVIDAQMESFDTSEATLCKAHLPFIKKGDLVIFDRYYASYELMGILMGKGVEFLFRMRKKSWKCVDEFIASEEKEKIVTLQLPKKCTYLLRTYVHLTDTLTIRLVKKKNRKGDIQVFATSLLDTDKYPAKSITNLYKKRWGIEEAYKLIKSRLEVADFSGKTLQAVQQDFYAKTMLLSLSAVLSFKVNPKVKGLPSRKKKETRDRKMMLNRTYIIYRTKKLIEQLHHNIETLDNMLDVFITKIQSKIEYSRKGQSVPRKIKKGINTLHVMSYKVI